MSDDIEKFAFDTILEETVRGLVREYGICSIVETGTWIGGTTRALAGMVRDVYTVEVKLEFYDQARETLRHTPNVTQFLGDSVDVLPRILPRLRHPTMYYLDAHWHGHHPLLEEIELIAAADPSPIIVIHDMQVPGHPDLKFDPRPGGLPYCYEWVEPYLQKIQRPWRHYYNSNAVGCKVGVLFVVPTEKL